MNNPQDLAAWLEELARFGPAANIGDRIIALILASHVSQEIPRNELLLRGPSSP